MTPALRPVLNDPHLHHQVALCIIYLSPITFAILMIYPPSTYGKLFDEKTNYFGPLLSAKHAWIVFESPNWIMNLIGILMYWLFPSDESSSEPKQHEVLLPNKLLLLLFFAHYIHRSIIYPLNMSSKSKFPIGLMLFTVPYTITNG